MPSVQKARLDMLTSDSERSASYLVRWSFSCETYGKSFVVSLRQRSVPINTIKSYAHDLRLFVQVVPADLPAVTAETLQAFLASFSHLSAATRRRRYCTLCAFYHWLIRHGVLETNPMERLDSIEQVQREPRPLPPETVNKILQAIPASNLRDRTLFTLLYETGIRVGDYIGWFVNAVKPFTQHSREPEARAMPPLTGVGERCAPRATGVLH